MLDEGNIELSSSPWRAQVIVVKGPRRKNRLVIDCSQTINRYTYLDAYPLPKIDYIVNEVAKGKIFSSVDLKSAYHQIPLSYADKPFTAFEANGRLYQFGRVPFGVTNGVSAFQRFIDEFIEKNYLKGVVAYLDDVTIFGRSQKEHDMRLHAFMSAADSHNLTLNRDKSVFSVTELRLLGHLISHGRIRPDPENLRPLEELAPPRNTAELKRVIGMFSYYSKWISRFSERLIPLTRNSKFPLNRIALNAFQDLRNCLSKASLSSIDTCFPFVVECDASDAAIAAILSQNGRPVAFLSRTLSKSEINHPP